MNEGKGLKIARRIKNRKRVVRKDDRIFLFPVGEIRNKVEVRIIKSDQARSTVSCNTDRLILKYQDDSLIHVKELGKLAL